MRRFRLVATSAAALTLIAAATPAGAKKPLPAQCSDGRFLVQGTPLIAGAATPTLEAVTLGTSVEITSGCGPVAAKVTRSRKGTVVKAAWLSCTGLPGKAKLKALVAAPACTTMTGTLTTTKTKPKTHPFTAARSVCGDHVVDPDAGGEECDGPGTCPNAGDTCSDACLCTSGGTTTSTTIVGATTSTTSSTSPVPTTTVTTTSVTTTVTEPTVSTTIVPTTIVPTTSTTSSTIANAPPAVVELNELEPALTDNHDLIELRVVSGGTVDGITIEQAGFNAAIVLATLPDVVVATDDLIVVHLNPLSGPGSPTTSETSGKAELPAATYLTNYDGAWDFLGSPSGIAFGTRVLQVRDAAGHLVDALPAFKQVYNPPAGFIAALQAVQAAGLWLPADCGGGPCTDATTPAAKDIIVDWTGVGTLSTDASVARRAGAHTHQASDWATGPSSMGAPNP